MTRDELDKHIGRLRDNERKVWELRMHMERIKRGDARRQRRRAMLFQLWSEAEFSLSMASGLGGSVERQAREHANELKARFLQELGTAVEA